MERISEIFVVLENAPATLGELCTHLAKNDINIESIGVFQDTAKLWIRNNKKAARVLEDLNYATEVRQVLRMELKNQPGLLAKITTTLGKKGINIESCYATSTKDAKKVAVIMDVSDIDLAIRVLQGK
ncbi:MAG: ACT domain-containing protein [Candidatus Aminicenantaceae bacterium]